MKTKKRANKPSSYLDRLYSGPVTVSRKQFDLMWEALRLAVQETASTIDANMPHGDPTEGEDAVLAIHEETLRQLKRLQWQLSHHISPRQLNGYTRRAA